MTCYDGSSPNQDNGCLELKIANEIDRYPEIPMEQAPRCFFGYLEWERTPMALTGHERHQLC